jgi:hypothetical protein
MPESAVSEFELKQTKKVTPSREGATLEIPNLNRSVRDDYCSVAAKPPKRQDLQMPKPLPLV